MRFRTVSLAAACCLLSVFPIGADVLTMKNGEKVQGTIISEEGANYVVEVHVTATIRDEKIIPRAEVLKIEKTPEYEKAFLELAALVPAPELLDVKGYEERITKLKDYIGAFPASPKTKHVEGMVKSLEEEMTLIKGGAIKLGEGIIPAEEYESNAYGYDAAIAEKKIREAVARRDLLGALRGFDSYETSFGESARTADLTTLIIQVLGAYSASITESLESFESRLAARNAGLVRMSPDARAKSLRALDAEQAELEERLEKEKSAKMKWITPHAFLKASLEEALKQATAELTRLEKAPTAEDGAIPLDHLYRTAWKHLKESTEEEREAIINDAKERALPAAYLEKLKKRAEKLAEEEAAAEEAAEDAEEDGNIDPFADDAGAEEPEKADDK